jgi:hypothetical protein
LEGLTLIIGNFKKLRIIVIGNIKIGQNSNLHNYVGRIMEQNKKDDNAIIA